MRSQRIDKKFISNTINGFNYIPTYLHMIHKNRGKITFLYSLTEKFNFRFSSAQFVGSATYVFPILPFFYSNNSNRCVSIFIRGCKVWYAVMLIIRQLYVVFEPDNGWWRICFYMTLQIHIVLQSLTESWPRSCDHWREFNLHVNVTSGAASNAVLSDAIIRSAILFPYGRDFQRVATAIFSDYIMCKITRLFNNNNIL